MQRADQPLCDRNQASVAGIGGGSSDTAMIGKLRAYAEKYIAASSRNATETAIANIEYRLKVRELRLPAINAWLQSHGG